ncbi:MAG TPA: alpha/beta hydrolase [Blastocatellia bacterium]|nr:alpha/beta hydrolase [Blastocatellia bacterium]
MLKRIALTMFFLLVTAQASQQNNAAPETLPGADSRVYKTIGATKLRLHIYQPAKRDKSDKLPAIVFFFGGGWRNGTPAQFVEHCKHLASRGMVAITAEYRVKARHNVTPLECIADAKSALRWVRKNAGELGIDVNRIAAGGGSAGGHLAAALATVNGFDDKSDDLKISAVPNALVLFNPALDVANVPADYGFGDKAVAASPLQNVKGKLPPTIIFHGTADTTVPFEQATKFCVAMRQQGNQCEVKPYEGRAHGFFNFGRGNGEDFKSTLQATDDFLVSLGYLKKT